MGVNFNSEMAGLKGVASNTSNAPVVAKGAKPLSSLTVNTALKTDSLQDRIPSITRVDSEPSTPSSMSRMSEPDSPSSLLGHFQEMKGDQVEARAPLSGASQVVASVSAPLPNAEGGFINKLRNFVEDIKARLAPDPSKQVVKMLNKLSNFSAKIDPNMNFAKFKELTKGFEQLRGKINLKEAIKNDGEIRRLCGDIEKKLSPEVGLKIALASPDAPSPKVSFRAFLKSELSSENIDYYEAVEKYVKEPSDAMAKEIGKKYIDDSSSGKFLDDTPSSMINIDSTQRKAAKEAIKSGDPTMIKDALLEAQKEIFKLMKGDTFNRFLSANEVNK